MHKSLKENHGKGWVTVTGVRWAESTKRRNSHSLITKFGSTRHDSIIYNDDNDEARRFVENCYRTSKLLLNPIINWKDEDVWEFIRTESIPYCELYDCGYTRLGCIGCPQSTRQEKELEQYPKYKALYLRAFERMLEVRRAKGKDDTTGLWKSPEHVYKWWIGKYKNRQIDGQLAMELDELSEW